jgi:hypothetical protein
MNLQENIQRIKQMMGLLTEEVKSEEMKDEGGLYGKLLSSISRFIRGKDLHDFLSKIKTVTSFDDFTLEFSKGHEGANQFIINIIDSNNDEKVGKFVAFIYKDSETKKHGLQIQKVEIYPKYKGKGIMRRFYMDFNKWLKSNFNDFGMFTSDFIFLYNGETGKYDGYNMWEDLVNKGLAVRLGPDESYIPPVEPPANKMWKLDYGYKLI